MACQPSLALAHLWRAKAGALRWLRYVDALAVDVDRNGQGDDKRDDRDRQRVQIGDDAEDEPLEEPCASNAHPKEHHRDNGPPPSVPDTERGCERTHGLEDETDQQRRHGRSDHHRGHIAGGIEYPYAASATAITSSVVERFIGSSSLVTHESTLLWRSEPWRLIWCPSSLPPSQRASATRAAGPVAAQSSTLCGMEQPHRRVRLMMDARETTPHAATAAAG